MNALVRNGFIGGAVGFGLSAVGISMLTLKGFIIGTLIIVSILAVLELTKE